MSSVTGKGLTAAEVQQVVADLLAPLGAGVEAAISASALTVEDIAAEVAAPSAGAIAAAVAAPSAAAIAAEVAAPTGPFIADLVHQYGSAIELTSDAGTTRTAETLYSVAMPGVPLLTKTGVGTAWSTIASYGGQGKLLRVGFGSTQTAEINFRLRVGGVVLGMWRVQATGGGQNMVWCVGGGAVPGYIGLNYQGTLEIQAQKVSAGTVTALAVVDRVGE